MEEMNKQVSGNLPEAYEHTSSKGDTYIVQPLKDLAEISGFPKEFLDKALMIRDGQIVHMTKKPLSDAEKAERKAERKADNDKMASLKDSIEQEYKAAMSEWKAETKKAAEEFRAPSEVIKLRAKKISEKWNAVKSTRTLEQTKKVLESFKG